jgi:OmcA/MtrC family decaheme c-type cytochrome
VDADPLHLEIQSVTIPEGANPRPVVRFRVTDQAGAPVDLMTELANWNLGVPTAANRTVPNTVPRFTLAQLDDAGNYTSYYAATVNPRTGWTAPGPLDDGLTPGPATQATTVPPTNPYPVADLRALGDGVFELTLPEPTVTGLDRTRTHTVAGWVARNPAQGAEQQISYDSFNFVPAGGAVALDEVVTDAACNQCHGALQAHGTRRGIQLCITCHSPQTTDPETGRTVDFKVMVHRIHAGEGLPSNLQGNPYYIVGFGNPVPTVHDYSGVVFPQTGGVAQCTVCHQGGEDADNWRTRPSREACTSCHDQVKFDGTGTRACTADLTTGQNWFDDCNHPAIPRADDPSLCATCHQPGAIAGYHGVAVP